MTLIKICNCRKTLGTSNFHSLLSRAPEGRAQERSWQEIKSVGGLNLSPSESSRAGPFILIPRRNKKYHTEEIQIVPISRIL